MIIRKRDNITMNLRTDLSFGGKIHDTTGCSYDNVRHLSLQSC